MNNLAWIVATSPQRQLRNPQQAVELAERACELTSYGKPGLLVLGTLAAAYASAGKFSKAVAAAEKALKLAQSLGDKELAGQIQERLALYKTSKPYIEHLPTDGGQRSE